MPDLLNVIDIRRSRRKLHFELGAGGGVWRWGNGAEFKRNATL